MTYSSDSNRGQKLELSAVIALAAAIAMHRLCAARDRSRHRRHRPGRHRRTPPAAGTTTPGPKAKLKNGFAIAPANAPDEVVAAIEAANEIVKSKPYCLGGGHDRRVDRCYDCSGTVSYALTGAGLLDFAMPSGSFMSWGRRGAGEWITVYAHGGHIYAVIAGLRLDTSMTVGDGPGWSKVRAIRRAFGLATPPASRRFTKLNRWVPRRAATMAGRGAGRNRDASSRGVAHRRRGGATDSPRACASASVRGRRLAARDLVRRPRRAGDGHRGADRDVGDRLRRLRPVRRDRGARGGRRSGGGDRSPASCSTCATCRWESRSPRRFAAECCGGRPSGRR